ncbi:hypothetical protein DFH06DRAFT_1197302 [Mycena polygramma]|nr:hypothetical protein DFH06DRAFT_1197302 [Mycena polygramma]
MTTPRLVISGSIGAKGKGGRIGGEGETGEAPQIAAEDLPFFSEIRGGTGGQGGDGHAKHLHGSNGICQGPRGGDGGMGEAPRIAAGDLRFFGAKLYGGIGGQGGEGGAGGLRGIDGISQESSNPPPTTDEQAVNTPNLTVAEFCRQYRVSREIQEILEKEGYKTERELREVTDGTLEKVGFEIGQIAELKRALKEHEPERRQSAATEVRCFESPV